MQTSRKGEVYFEYETHYYEFDENGRYMDDWKFWYNDPFAIIPRIDRVLAGCHSLICLEEYQIVFDLLSSELRFFVKDSEDSDDIPEKKIISLSDVGEKEMLSKDLSSAAEDCIQSFTYLTEGQDNQKRAHKIIEMLEHSVYQGLKPRMLKDNGVSQELFSLMTIIYLPSYLQVLGLHA